MLDFLYESYNIRNKKKYPPSIVCLHDIPDIGKLANIIRALKNIFTIVSLDDLLNERKENTLAFTFDDGYKEWAYGVKDLLKSESITATFFVSYGMLDTKMSHEYARYALRRTLNVNLLSPDDAIVLSRANGCEIGSHTVSHNDLGVVSDDAVLNYEICESKALLQNLLNVEVRKFAFPFGGKRNVKANLKQYFVSADYDSAFTIVPGSVETVSNNYLIPRYSIDPSEPIRHWLVKLAGVANFRKYI